MNLLPAHGPRCAHFAVVTVRVPRLNTKNLFRSKRRHGRASQFVLAESEGRSSVLFECKESGKLAAPIRARCRNFEIQNRARTIAFIQVRFGCLCRKLSRLYLSRHTQVAVDATRRTPWQCSRFVPPPPRRGVVIGLGRKTVQRYSSRPHPLLGSSGRRGILSG